VPLLPSVQPGGGTATPAPAAPAGPTRLRPPSRGVPAGYGQDPAAEPGAPDRAAPSDPGVRNAEPAPKPPNTPPTTPRTGGA
jgi:hypothetical protein